MVRTFIARRGIRSGRSNPQGQLYVCRAGGRYNAGAETELSNQGERSSLRRGLLRVVAALWAAVRLSDGCCMMRRASH